MLISAFVDGRLTSDVSFLFKVPIEPETNAIIKEQMDLEESANYGSSQNVSISRYKKMKTPNESLEPKDTSAASFTTSVTISQLPLIWTAFLLVIAVLVTLILLVLIRLHVSKKRKKPHVRFSRHHQMITEPASDLCNGLR